MRRFNIKNTVNRNLKQNINSTFPRFHINIVRMFLKDAHGHSTLH